MIDVMLPATSAAAAMFGALNLILQRRLRRARHDPLTGLAARQLWTSRVDREMRRPQGLIVLIIDVDDFKQINDRHGHDAGDAMLVAIAQRLQAWARGHGLAGRLGGDEFAAFVRLTDDDNLGRRLDALCAQLSAPVRYRGRVLRAGASIGAVVVDGLAMPVRYQAMRAADEALYQAKRAGRGTWRVACARSSGLMPTHA